MMRNPDTKNTSKNACLCVYVRVHPRVCVCVMKDLTARVDCKLNRNHFLGCVPESKSVVSGD